MQDNNNNLSIGESLPIGGLSLLRAKQTLANYQKLRKDQRGTYLGYGFIIISINISQIKNNFD